MASNSQAPKRRKVETKEEKKKKKNNTPVAFQIQHDELYSYFTHLFPYEEVSDWLTFTTTPAHPLRHREFAFVLPGDIWVRSQSMNTIHDLKTHLCNQRKTIERVDIGAIYADVKTRHLTPRCELKELVFDIDLDDYDLLRLCPCKGRKTCCNQCWIFIRAAIAYLCHFLHQYFGFHHMSMVFSGRRGVHCWVHDLTAMGLDQHGREAVLNYIANPHSLFSGSKKRMGFEELPCFTKEAYQILERYFHQWLVQEPDWFCKPFANITMGQKMLTFWRYHGRLQTRLKTIVQDNTPAAHKWKCFKNLSSSQNYNGTGKAKTNLVEAVLFFMMPKFDRNVTIQREHCLKLPFNVHPKTGKICVPILNMDTFNPDQVPSYIDVIEDYNETSRMNKLSLMGTLKRKWKQQFHRKYGLIGTKSTKTVYNIKKSRSERDSNSQP